MRTIILVRPSQYAVDDIDVDKAHCGFLLRPGRTAAQLVFDAQPTIADIEHARFLGHRNRFEDVDFIMRIPIADAALLAFQMAEHMQVTRLSSGLIGIGHYHFHLVGHQIVQAHAVQTGEIGRLVERRSTLIAFPVGDGSLDELVRLPLKPAGQGRW